MFSLCAKLRMCPLFEISTIDQALFRGWGPPVRGGIVIWIARALRVLGATVDSMLSGYGCTCCHLHCCEVFKMHERHHAQMKSEIMNGNQGDHVTFVSSWRRSKQGLSFCRTFHPFIQHHDADAAHRRTLRSPEISGRGPTMCSKCHACMPVCKM